MQFVAPAAEFDPSMPGLHLLLKKVATALHGNLKAVRRHASSCGMLLVEFALCMRRNATSGILVKILTTLLDSVTPIFQKRAIIWCDCKEFFRRFFTV